MTASVNFLRVLGCLVVFALLALSPVRAQEADRGALAAKVHGILKATCHRCHGENGANEGGFNYLLNHERLLGTKKGADAIEELYLATLSRRPTDEEMKSMTAYVSSAPTMIEGYGDVLWALLNCSEYTLVR